MDVLYLVGASQAPGGEGDDDPARRTILRWLACSGWADESRGHHRAVPAGRAHAGSRDDRLPSVRWPVFPPGYGPRPSAWATEPMPPADHTVWASPSAGTQLIREAPLDRRFSTRWRALRFKRCGLRSGQGGREGSRAGAEPEEDLQAGHRSGCCRSCGRICADGGRRPPRHWPPRPPNRGRWRPLSSSSLTRRRSRLMLPSATISA